MQLNVSDLEVNFKDRAPAETRSRPHSSRLVEAIRQFVATCQFDAQRTKFGNEKAEQPRTASLSSAIIRQHQNQQPRTRKSIKEAHPKKVSTRSDFGYAERKNG